MKIKKLTPLNYPYRPSPEFEALYDKIQELTDGYNQLTEKQCKHDWIEYDRERDDLAIDICRNCPATRTPPKEVDYFVRTDDWVMDLQDKFPGGILTKGGDTINGYNYILNDVRNFIYELLEKNNQKIWEEVVNTGTVNVLKDGNIIDIKNILGIKN